MRFDKMQKQDKINLLSEKLKKSLHEILMVEQKISVIEEIEPTLYVDYSVAIKISGDINGTMLINADESVFHLMSEKFYGWKLSDWMLVSFVGEVVNMITGHFTTELSLVEISTYLKEPKMRKNKLIPMTADLRVQLVSEMENIGNLNIYLLID